MQQDTAERKPPAPKHLDASIRDRDGVPVLDLQGDVDVSTAPIFRQAVTDLVSEGVPCILINMSQVGFMDSSGFGTLLGAMKRLRPTGGAIHLVGCNHTIRRMLHLTRLETVLGVHSTEEDALRACATGAAA
jgi:anti-sigma B factor antagonist